MPRILIFADDLTGTNSTAAMVRRYGYEACAAVDLTKKYSIPGDCECLGINLDSRGSSGNEAANRMATAVKYYFSGAEALCSKRIDSTLRGYLGIETDSLLEALGGGRMAMIVPALPDAGRQFYDGVLYVDGIPLHETAAAKDPAHPVTSSSPGQMFREQSVYKTGEIPLAQIRGGTGHLAEIIADRKAEGYRNLVFEADGNEDIERIARAVLASRIPFVAVDPGAFTCRLAAAMKTGGESQPVSFRKRDKILAVTGSVNPVTKLQMKQAADDYKAIVSLEIDALLKSKESCEAAMNNACEQIMDLAKKQDVCILTLSSVLEADHIPFQDYAKGCKMETEAIIQRVNTAIAGTAGRILEQDHCFGGLFTCGGDITSAVCNVLQASVIRILDEVIPLAVYGQLKLADGRSYELVTKGGMVGKRTDMAVCLDYLKKQL